MVKKEIQKHEKGPDNQDSETKVKEKNNMESEHITVMMYNADKLEEKKISLSEILENKKFIEDSEGYKLWINLDDDYDGKVVETICGIFGIHPLVMEDIIEKGQRPKVEDYENYIFSVAKMIYYKDEDLVLEQLSFITGKNYLITFGEEEGDVFDRVRSRLRKEGSLIRKEGVDFLLYNLVDSLVEGYFHTLEIMGEKIDVIEEKVIASKTNEEQKEIRELKKDLLFIHKYSWPLREVASWLAKEDSDIIGKPTKLYFDDVSSQLVQVIDTTDTYRELLSGLIEISLSNISYRLNEVMKVLTIISTIFMPLSFIAGVYGMNFKYMPELNEPWGYPMVWAVMVVISLAMIYYFRKKKWF